MAIRFACPCGQALEAEPEHAGLATVCPQCQRDLTIPAVPARPPVAQFAPPHLPDSGFTVVENPPFPTASRAKSAAPPPRPPLTNRYDDDGTPARRKTEADDDEDDRPRKNRHYDDDDAHEDEEGTRRPRMRRRLRDDEPTGINWTMVGGGILVMVLMVVWFVVGWAAGRIFFYPPIGFIAGLVAVVRGLMGHQKD